MILYQIEVKHVSPKDSHRSTQAYLIAENDEQVYEWIKSEPMDNMYVHWNDAEENGDIFEIYDDDYEFVGTEMFKERMLRIKGEINDDDYDFSDAYYGITLYGWKKIGKISQSQLQVLEELGIAFEIE